MIKINIQYSIILINQQKAKEYKMTNVSEIDYKEKLQECRSNFGYLQQIFMDNCEISESDQKILYEYASFSDDNDLELLMCYDSSFRQKMENNVEDEIEDDVEDEIEDDVEDEIEDDVEDEIEDDVEDENLVKIEPGYDFIPVIHHRQWWMRSHLRFNLIDEQNRAMMNEEKAEELVDKSYEYFRKKLFDKGDKYCDYVANVEGKIDNKSKALDDIYAIHILPQIKQKMCNMIVWLKENNRERYNKIMKDEYEFYEEMKEIYDDYYDKLTEALYDRYLR